MPRPKTGATHYHAQLRRPDKGRAIKVLVVCNSWDLNYENNYFKRDVQTDKRKDST